LRVYQSDSNTNFLLYASAEQQANVKELLEWNVREFVGWDKNELKQYFIAGFGDPTEFEKSWQMALSASKQRAKALRENCFDTAGGGAQYLISARKVE
jgi:hypothetical protein